MATNWKDPKVFKRFSSIFTFSKNPLFQKNENTHIYIPWDPEIENELMFQMKAKIGQVGSTLIPYMDLEQHAINFNQEELNTLMGQLEKGIETHLVMSNFDSIHVFRVTNLVIGETQLEESVEKILDQFSRHRGFKHYIEVDDVYVLEANHTKESGTLISNLDQIMSRDQTQKIFIAPHRKELEVTGVHKKWVEQGRNVTYDYFIRQCELKDNIYQEMWDFLSRNTQHHLINCELNRNKSVFERGQGKGKLLVESFSYYKQALISELNEVYILPLVDAIQKYGCLQEAWRELQENALINRDVTLHIQKILDGKSTSIEDLNDFLFYTKNAKSFFFSLKNMFAKKIHKEEFLLVENFLIKQEGLIDSFRSRSLKEKVVSIIHIDEWIGRTIDQIDLISLDELKDLNLKLSYLLSVMVSASYEDNIFFKLIEEKAAKGKVQRSFEDEVKNLLNLDIKKETA
ncbi:MAG: hypothetical protein CME65_01950 [Halobacteriovoraceae bacterium]|nr:hypothetical protein [Halobacteriovoraceae bacterium]|tara:strand:- start:7713 stop:9089 length:1377 start_codon:yes stop_codon:yes gene_type:complete